MITVRLSGGMGNQMFQYATGHALAIKNNTSLALDTTFLLHRYTFSNVLRPHFAFRNFDLDVFQIDASVADSNSLRFWQKPFFPNVLSGKVMLFLDAVLRRVPVLPGWEKKFTFDKKVLSYGPDTYLSGYWQSEKYFVAIREALLVDFTLRVPLIGAALQLQEEIKKNLSVCVHVRRSDIAVKSFHGACDKEYYGRAFTELIARANEIQNRKKLTVYVFSDDLEWCKENLRLPVSMVFVSDEYFGEKGECYLTLMSTCKHFIIPNSTFSWWAAWLCRYPHKIVIAPKVWFANGRIDTRDLIPEEWIRI